MAELDDIAARADAFEKQAEQSKKVEPEVVGQVAAPDPMQAAANMAESLLKTAEAGVKFFFDQRLCLGDEELGEGKDSLAPVIEKYNLTAGGNGKLPYQEEIVAGFYLGGLWKRFRRALASLRAVDEANAKAKREQEQANGNQRKHQPEEQPRPVPSEVRVREESDDDTPGWLTKPGSASPFMGQQSGSSGAPV